MKKFLIFLAFAAMASPAFGVVKSNTFTPSKGGAGDLGVIAKYGLPGSPLLPEGSSNLGFWHIGIVLGF